MEGVNPAALPAFITWEKQNEETLTPKEAPRPKGVFEFEPTIAQINTEEARKRARDRSEEQREGKRRCFQDMRKNNGDNFKRRKTNQGRVKRERAEDEEGFRKPRKTSRRQLEQSSREVEKKKNPIEYLIEEGITTRDNVERRALRQAAGSGEKFRERSQTGPRETQSPIDIICHSRKIRIDGKSSERIESR